MCETAPILKYRHDVWRYNDATMYLEFDSWFIRHYILPPLCVTCVIFMSRQSCDGVRVINLSNWCVTLRLQIDRGVANRIIFFGYFSRIKYFVLVWKSMYVCADWFIWNWKKWMMKAMYNWLRLLLLISSYHAVTPKRYHYPARMRFVSVSLQGTFGQPWVKVFIQYSLYSRL